jgi:hypothetical protein
MNKTERRERHWGWIFCGALALIVLAWAISWFALYHYFPDNSARALFGEAFGSVSALFSGLAFAGLVVAILIQRDELQLQRDELELTREELRGQKEQLTKQAEIFRKQMFESTFFQLIRLHHDLVDALSLTFHARPFVGRKCFDVFFEVLKGAFEKRIKESRTKSPDEIGDLRSIEQVYEEFYQNYQSDVGH